MIRIMIAALVVASLTACAHRAGTDWALVSNQVGQTIAVQP